MATIALYAAQVNQMSGLLSEVKRTVTDYKSELAALKKKTLTINQSICNLESVLSSIQTSTKLQEQKSESLDTVKQNSEEFIEETDRIDGAVAEAIQQRTDNFYQQYSYLKPECQKSWAEKAKNWFTEAGAWCKKYWTEIKAAVTVVLLIAAVIVLCVGTGGILGAIALGALLGAAIGGITGGAISAMMGGSFWEGFVNGAFIGAIGGMISGGMGFALAGKAALTLGQTFAVGAASGSGVSLVNDMETILIGGELSLGEVIRNMLIGGTFGAIFAGIGYGMSKAFAALKVKFAEVKGASGAKYEITWNKNINATQEVIEGTNIPKSFTIKGIKINGNEAWVHGNATKHMGEFVKSAKGSIIVENELLLSFQDSLTKVLPKVQPGRNFFNIDGWEIGINGDTGVIYHALHK